MVTIFFIRKNERVSRFFLKPCRVWRELFAYLVNHFSRVMQAGSLMVSEVRRQSRRKSKRRSSFVAGRITKSLPASSAAG